MEERNQIEQAIAALEAQRTVLGDTVVDAAISSMREKLVTLGPTPERIERRKHVTVLFSDLCGFTAMAENMDPEEVRDVINSYFTAVTPAIKKRGGNIEKFIGDAIMAVFGLPQAHEHDPENAVRAALDMQQALIQLNQRLHQEKNIELAMRIGINTGPVIATFLGNRRDKNFTVVGDTVNTASRLETAAPENGILISHQTYRHVRGVFNVRPLDAIPVKGKSELLAVYQVQQAKPRAFRLGSRGVEGIETRMIGRRREIQLLQKVFHLTTSKDQQQMVTIIGDAGLGKSRLLYEFENWYELQPTRIHVFKSRAQQQTRQLPFSLIRELFAFRFQIQDSDEGDIARQKLEEGITAYLREDGTEKAHLIGQLLGLDFSDSLYIRHIINDARQIHDRAFHYIIQFFTAMMQTAPVVIMAEDLQWADHASLDMLTHLAERIDTFPLLIISAARPSLLDKRPSWGQTVPGHRQITLKSLSNNDSRRLIHEILRHVPAIPPNLQETIVKQAEGNPFYVEEMIKMLIDDGVIIKGDSQWRIVSTRLAGIRVPATLAGILQARLDRLAAYEYEVLQRASVIGRTFWNEAVFFLGHNAPRVHNAPHNHNAEDNYSYPNANANATRNHIYTFNDIQQALAALCEKELIFRQEESTFAGIAEYSFKHHLLHDAIYDSVLKSQRRQFHQRAAAWLLAQSGDRADEHAALIAGHYERSHNEPLAATWYGRAGKQAEDAYAPATAIDHYHKALNLHDLAVVNQQGNAAQNLDAKIPWQHGLGSCLRRQVRYSEAIVVYQNMQATAKAVGDLLSQAVALNGLSFVQSLQGDHRNALISGEQAADIARSMGGSKEGQIALAQAMYEQGFAYYRLGEANRALSLGEQALALSILYFEQLHMARSLNLLGSVHQMMGNHEWAMDYHQQALALSRTLGDRRNMSANLNNLGETARLRWDFTAAQQYYEEALTIAREIGDRDGEMTMLSNLASVRIRLGEYEMAINGLRRVIEMVGKNVWYNLSETYRHLAAAYLGLNKLQEAIYASKRAIQLAQTTEDQELIGSAWRVIGQVAAYADQMNQPLKLNTNLTTTSMRLIENADSFFAESLRIFTQTDIPAERALTLQAWARYAHQTGANSHGDTMWQEARSIFQKLSMDRAVTAMDEERLQTKDE